MLAASILAWLAWPAAVAESPDREERLRGVQQQVRRLQGELRALETRERGVLGELERLGARLRLREAEHEQVRLRLESVSHAIVERTEQLDRLEQVQHQRRRYLAFRLREIYKEGPERSLRRLVGGSAVESYLAGLRYAAYLSERDARVLREFREDSERLRQEQARLLQTRTELEQLRTELEGARQRLAAARRSRARALREIRDDKSTRQAALDELQGAAGALRQLLESVDRGPASVALDVRKFRGLLDWPAAGEVTAGFGSIVHPRFKTEVPHPGLDIEAPPGTDIVSVFDGRVVFASWMRGYGLTAIVDHGHGVLSIYAHASALIVEAGESVLRGQRLGKIGETGSLQGPYLYFELRFEGRAVDPRGWLRPR